MPGRKGKNRCEPDPNGVEGVCKRCAANNIKCVFEKAQERGGRARNGSVVAEGLSNEAEGWVLIMVHCADNKPSVHLGEYRQITGDRSDPDTNGSTADIVNATPKQLFNNTIIRPVLSIPARG